jgi:hypothetical protein
MESGTVAKIKRKNIKCRKKFMKQKIDNFPATSDLQWMQKYYARAKGESN